MNQAARGGATSRRKARGDSLDTMGLFNCIKSLHITSVPTLERSEAPTIVLHPFRFFWPPKSYHSPRINYLRIRIDPGYHIIDYQRRCEETKNWRHFGQMADDDVEN